MNTYICQYCGKDTSEIEYDYLSGTDHLGCVLKHEKNNMEILSVKTMTSTITEFIETKCGKTYVLVQMYTANNSVMSYSVFDLNGAEVTDEPEINEMMGRYFSVKSELESGLYSDDDTDDLDPYK